MNRAAVVRYAALLAAGILAVLAGCSGAWGRQEQGSGTAADTAPGSWRIEYELTGGFAGVRRSLRIASDGRLTVEDLRAKAVIDRQAEPAEVAAIAALLAEAERSGAAELHQGLRRPCADCYEHGLIVVIDGRERRERMNDLSLRGNPYAPLIGYLSSMMRKALSDVRTGR